MPDSRFDVAVIGGGIAGLSAAFYLRRSGHSVALFEPSRLGGVIQSKQFDGFTLEQAPNVFVEKEAIVELRSLLKLDSSTLYPAVPNYKQYVWHAGGVHRVPRSPPALIGSKLLSPGQKFRLIKGLFNRHRFEDEDPSVSKFFSNLIGEQAVERLLDPALRGIFGGDISKLSARAIFPLLSNEIIGGDSIFSYMRNKPKGSKRKIFTIKGGNARLTSALRTACDGVAFFDSAVKAVRSINTGHEFEVCAEDSEPLRCRAVVVASSGSATGKYIGTISEELANRLSEIKYAPIAVCHLSSSASELRIKDGFGILFPSSTGQALMGIMFNSVLFPEVAPAGQAVLTVCFGGMQHPEVCELSEQQLLAEAQRAVAETLGVTKSRALAFQLWPNAIPQYEIGHIKIWDKMHALEERYPGLMFVGADIGGIGVPDRIETARAAALRISTILRGSKESSNLGAQRAMGV